MEKISIIVPIFNVEEYLDECLSSLTSQNDTYYEIILVNDGSNDLSEEICKKYLKKYSNIKYYKKENGGVSSARNYGLIKATGDFICFVDPDDIVSTNYLEIIRETIKNNSFDLIIYGHNLLYKNKKIKMTFKYNLFFAFLIVDIEFGNHIIINIVK